MYFGIRAYHYKTIVVVVVDKQTCYVESLLPLYCISSLSNRKTTQTSPYLENISVNLGWAGTSGEAISWWLDLAFNSAWICSTNILNWLKRTGLQWPPACLISTAMYTIFSVFSGPPAADNQSKLRPFDRTQKINSFLWSKVPYKHLLLFKSLPEAMEGINSILCHFCSARETYALLQFSYFSHDISLPCPGFITVPSIASENPHFEQFLNLEVDYIFALMSLSTAAQYVSAEWSWSEGT